MEALEAAEEIQAEAQRQTVRHIWSLFHFTQEQLGPFAYLSLTLKCLVLTYNEASLHPFSLMLVSNATTLVDC